VARKVLRRERVHVDLALELVVLGAAVAVALGRRLGAHQRAPRGRHPVGGTLGVVRDPVAVAGGLTRERHDAARLQHAQELRERAVEVRQVVQDGVAEDEVEGLGLERQLLGIARHHVDVDAETVGVGLQRREHPGRDVGAGGVPDHAGERQVQREVAGAGTDLERLGERPERPADQLAELAEHLRLADLAEVDAPLGVVAGGGAVVVAGVDVADLFSSGRGRHRSRKCSLTRS
jgi:hypothetical protein